MVQEGSEVRIDARARARAMSRAGARKVQGCTGLAAYGSGSFGKEKARWANHTGFLGQSYWALGAPVRRLSAWRIPRI